MTTPARSEAVALALASGEPHRSIADSLGVSERTVRRYAADPTVAARVREARRATWEHGLGALLDKVTAAVGVLDDVMTDDGAPATARVAAARAVLSSSLRAAALATIAERENLPADGLLVDYLRSLGPD